MTDLDKINEYMESLEHSLKPEIEELRNIIKNANRRLQERIKWNAPSYHYENLDMAAFNFKNPNRIILVFIFPKGIVSDDSGILVGDYKDRRLAYFNNMEDVKSKKSALEKVINDWMDLIDKHS